MLAFLYLFDNINFGLIL